MPRSSPEPERAQNNLQVVEVFEDARLFLTDQATGFEARFMTSLPRSEAGVPGVPGMYFYTHAVVSGRRWLLDRTDGTGEMFGYAEVDTEEMRCQSVLVVPEELVDMVLTHTLGDNEAAASPATQTTAAEKLYNEVKRQNLHLSGSVINACAVYSTVAGRETFRLVDAAGGFSVGQPTRDGVVTETELQRMVPRQRSKAARRAGVAAMS